MTALELANYIIDKCSKSFSPISNLKLQKMLYFIWKDYYFCKNSFLFTDKFYAWQLGPVIPEVYYKFCAFGGKPILLHSEENNIPDNIIIDNLIKKYIKFSARELVSKTHEKGTPWDIIFDEGRGDKREIPFKLIIEEETLS